MSDRPVSLDPRTLAGDAGSLQGQQQPQHRTPHDVDPSLTERFAAALAVTPADEHQSDEAVLDSPFALLRHIVHSPEKLPPSTEQPVNEGSWRDTLPLEAPPDSDADPLAPAERLVVEHRSDLRGLAIPALIPGQPGALVADQPDSPLHLARQPLLDGIADLAKRLLVSDGSNSRREVRIELSDSALSGVNVSVYQASGEWVAEFNCLERCAFNLLADAASSMAQELADTLRSPTCWLVMMEPPDDHTVEARALPERTTSR